HDKKLIVVLLSLFFKFAFLFLFFFFFFFYLVFNVSLFKCSTKMLHLTLGIHDMCLHLSWTHHSMLSFLHGPLTLTVSLDRNRIVCSNGGLFKLDMRSVYTYN